MLALIAAMLSGGVIGVVKGTLSGTGIAATLRDGGVGVVERLSSGTVVSLVDDVFMSVTVVGVPTCWFSTTEILNVLFLKTTSHECCEGGRETETKSPLSPAKNKKMNEVSKEKLTDFDAVRVYSHRGYGERNGELNRQRHVRCDVNPVCTHKCTTRVEIPPHAKRNCHPSSTLQPSPTPSPLLMSGQKQPLPKQKKDDREWTTAEQKEHLLSKQGGYATARQQGRLKTWFGIEMVMYFAKFPTLPVTEEERLIRGGDWTLQHKRNVEESVSL
jgi:hypothetical protein